MLDWSGMWGVRRLHKGIALFVMFLSLSANSDCLIGHMGKFGGGGRSCIAFRGCTRSVVPCQRWSVSHILRQDPKESPLHDSWVSVLIVYSLIPQPIFTELHIGQSRHQLPSGVANSRYRYDYMETVWQLALICLPVKNPNQNVMNGF